MYCVEKMLKEHNTDFKVIMDEVYPNVRAADWLVIFKYNNEIQRLDIDAHVKKLVYATIADAVMEGILI